MPFADVFLVADGCSVSWLVVRQIIVFNVEMAMRVTLPSGVCLVTRNSFFRRILFWRAVVGMLVLPIVLVMVSLLKLVFCLNCEMWYSVLV